LAFAIAMAAGEVGAVTPASPDNTDTPPVRHKAKPDSHHTAERPGGAKAAAAKPDPKSHPIPPVAAVPPPVPKPPAKEAPVKESTEPPPKIPRFAALKTDDTNMRKGPGQRYPIEWVYQRRDLPVEVEREYDVWRYVRDPDGVEGWVHQVTLSDRRTFMITGNDATLRSDAKDTASPVALLKVGVIGRLRECDTGSQWCQVQIGGYKGYLRRDQFWGLLPDEALAPS
jgi:SH3-like domain-containing protein